MDDSLGRPNPAFNDWLERFGEWRFVTGLIEAPGREMPAAAPDAHARVVGRGHPDGGADLYLALPPEEDFEREMLRIGDPAMHGLDGDPAGYPGIGCGGRLTARFAGVERRPGEIHLAAGVEAEGAEALLQRAGVASPTGARVPTRFGSVAVMALSPEAMRILGIAAAADAAPAATPSARMAPG